MDLRLANKHAVLVGAGRGLGAAAALSLAREGAEVTLLARTKADVEARAEECRKAGAPRATAIAADATKELPLPEKFDILVTLVGGSAPGGTLEADFAQAMQRNFFAALHASRLAIERGAQVILHVASIWGREGGGSISYNAAKAALISLAHEQARELAPKGIRVLSVAPGSILHPGGSWEKRQQADPAGIAAFVQREIPWGRFGSAEEVGDAIAFLVSPRASWICGACVTIDGAQSKSF